MKTNHFLCLFPFCCTDRKEPKDMTAPERVDEHPEGRYHIFILSLTLFFSFLGLCEGFNVYFLSVHLYAVLFAFDFCLLSIFNSGSC